MKTLQLTPKAFFTEYLNSCKKQGITPSKEHYTETLNNLVKKGYLTNNQLEQYAVEYHE